MKLDTYQRFLKDDLILRDELAIDRTLLSNERTLLAYLRSGVALALAGITFAHFSQQLWFELFGWLCVPVGVLVILIGTARYRLMREAIGTIRRALEAPTNNGEEARLLASERNARGGPPGSP